MLANFCVVAASYLLGSLPTGVWVSRKLVSRDIREMGNGNTGARNVTHMLGWKAGIFVGMVDFAKAMLSVLIAKGAGVSLSWQMAAGAAAVLGHDFPLLAGFRGGQGMAASIGTMAALLTHETLVGLLIFGLVYLFSRLFDLSAAVGLGTLAYLVWRSDHPEILLYYTVSILLTIPLKKLLDCRLRVKKIGIK